MNAMVLEIWIGILGNAAWFIFNVVGSRALKKGQTNLQHWIDRRQGNRHSSQSYGEAFESPKNAIVYTVGGQAATIKFSINIQKPQMIGLICTEQTKQVAEEIKQLFDPTGIRCKLEICDAYDIVEIREKTRLIFGWLARNGVIPSDAVLDPTGGMTSMSIAAYSVAEEMGIDSQYLRSDFDDHNKRVSGTEKAAYISRHSAASSPQPILVSPMTSEAPMPSGATLSSGPQSAPVKQEKTTLTHL